MIYYDYLILYPFQTCKLNPLEIAEAVLKNTHTSRTEVFLQRFSL